MLMLGLFLTRKWRMFAQVSISLKHYSFHSDTKEHMYTYDIPLTVTAFEAGLRRR